MQRRQKDKIIEGAALLCLCGAIAILSATGILVALGEDPLAGWFTIF